MDWQPEKPDGDDDLLDRLLAEARWAEPAPAAIDRLRGHWHRLMLRRRRRRRFATLLLAASILVTAIGLASWPRSEPGAEQRKTTNVAEKNVAPTPQPLRQQVPPARQQPHSLLAKKHMPADPPVVQTSRPPNVYERMVMIAYRRARASRTRRIEPPPVAAPVEQAAEQPAVDQQAALRQQIAALLAQNDLRSVEAFLRQVADRRTSADALDCLAAAPNPPVELLFRCLRSPRAAQRTAERTAAALALGRLNRPEISRRLIAIILRGTDRREAMIALLSSSEPTARQFVADAERNRMLSATLWNAKRQFQSRCRGGS